MTGSARALGVAILVLPSLVAACAAVLDLDSVSYDNTSEASVADAMTDATIADSAMTDGSIADALPIDAGLDQSAPDAQSSFCAQFPDAAYCQDFNDASCLYQVFPTQLNMLDNSCLFSSINGTVAIEAGALSFDTFGDFDGSTTFAFQPQLDQSRSALPLGWSLYFDLQVVSAPDAGGSTSKYVDLAMVVNKSEMDTRQYELKYYSTSELHFGSAILPVTAEDWIHVRLDVDLSDAGVVTTKISAQGTATDASSEGPLDTSGTLSNSMTIGIQTFNTGWSYRIDNVALIWR
jgi:hypothetical protein